MFEDLEFLVFPSLCCLLFFLAYFWTKTFTFCVPRTLPNHHSADVCSKQSVFFRVVSFGWPKSLDTRLRGFDGILSDDVSGVRGTFQHRFASRWMKSTMMCHKKAWIPPIPSANRFGNRNSWRSSDKSFSPFKSEESKFDFVQIGRSLSRWSKSTIWCH